MPSIFEWVNKKMAKKLGGKDLKPVKCLLDATKFCQFHILWKNSQSGFGCNQMTFQLNSPSWTSCGHVLQSQVLPAMGKGFKV
jgi:hypothetical protein